MDVTGLGLPFHAVSLGDFKEHHPVSSALQSAPLGQCEDPVRAAEVAAHSPCRR